MGHHRLEAFITGQLGRRPDNIDKVLPHFEQRSCPRHTVLLNAGDPCHHIYFVVSGALQVFIYDTQGNECTWDIMAEDQWCTDITSLTTGNPATDCIRTIERTELLCLHKDSYAQLMQEIPQFAAIYKQILEASYLNSIYRVHSFISLNALERIQWLMQHRPALASRMPSKLLASYLGISQETFSRLRGKA